MLLPPPSERLTFESMGPRHRADMLRVYGDLDAMRWVGDGTAITEEECERWFDVTAENLRRRVEQVDYIYVLLFIQMLACIQCINGVKQ